MRSKSISRPKGDSLFKTRLQKLQSLMKQNQLDCCLIENPLDLYYFTGIRLSAGRLIATRKMMRLYVDGRYLQVAQETAPLSVALESKNSLLEFFKEHPIKTVAFDGGHTSYDRFKQLKSLCQKKSQLIPSSPFFKQLRVVKDKTEIAKMKKSAALLWKGFQWIISSLKKGIKEKEVAKGFEIFCLEKGADSLSFDPIIAFGSNSAMPHYRSQNVALREGDIVLVDIGVVVDQYHSDMTRVLFYKKEDPVLSQLYQIVQRAQKQALALCRPGMKLGQLDVAAREVFRQEKVEDLFVHSLGHGIGLETHEFPRLKHDGEDKDLLLEQGMVFTVEPGLYLPGKGGVRYEDTIVITSKGYENFYPN